MRYGPAPIPVAELSSLDRFVARFALPLVAGGPVYIDGLIGPGALAGWYRQGNPEIGLLMQLRTEVRGLLAKMGPVGECETVPLDAFALAAVWHNLLAVSHPDAVSSERLRRSVRQWCDTMLGWIDPPRTRAEVALRHGILGRLGSLGRIDTRVSFWAGYADFVGVAPPPSLLAWKTVRRVREDKHRVDLNALLGGLDTEKVIALDAQLLPVVSAALAASPLTDIMLADRPSAYGFQWNPGSVNALGDACLRGAAQRLLLGRGAAAVRAVEQASLATARDYSDSRVVSLTLLRFHLELLCLDAMSARATEKSTAVERGRDAPGALPSPTSVPQPLAMDAYLQLGPGRAGELLGLDPELLRRTLPLDPNRPIPKDPPSAPLLIGAGVMETRP